jgi:hypothetical protein
MPGMAEEIDGAMQQAPHPARQGVWLVIPGFYANYLRRLGNWNFAQGTHPASYRLA